MPITFTFMPIVWSVDLENIDSIDIHVKNNKKDKQKPVIIELCFRSIVLIAEFAS